MNTNNSAASSRIGLFGGTFDPIHQGHIRPLEQAAKLLRLDSINIIPANIPPHKSTTQTSAQHRAEMVKLVCQNHPLLTFDDRELQQAKPSYTVGTLSAIKQEQPNSQLFFFIGMDSLITFTAWHQWQTILELAHLVVMPRPNYTIEQVPQELKPLVQNLMQDIDKTNIETSKQSGNIYLVESAQVNISSTEIRAFFKQPSSIANDRKHLLLDNIAPKVHQYILEHHLYQK